MKTLGEFSPGSRAVLVGISPACDSALALRLMQLGFVAGEEVEVVRQAPWFKDPIVVRVRGTLIGLRRHEAKFLEVQS